MWLSFRLTLAAAAIVVVSFFIVALASTFALVRAQVERVDVDLASAIEADYSADPLGGTLAPLGEGIVAVARQDVIRLEETLSGVEIVPVYHQPASAATKPEVFATPSASPGQAPPTSDSNEGGPTPPPTQSVSPAWTPSGLPTTVPPGTPPPASPIATLQPTPAPTSSPTPGPTSTFTLTPAGTKTPTPLPSASPTGSPTRTPTPAATPTVMTPTVTTPTATPAPTASPTLTPTESPTPTRTPTPTPTPSSTPPPLTDLTLYLHNNPTPPLGDTSSQHELPMDAVLPVAPVLYNYDTDRDSSGGLLIVKGGSSADEGDDAKHQHWFGPEFPAAVTLQGSASLKLWSAMQDFNTGLGGVVTAYLRDCEGWTCLELGSETLDTHWQPGSTWTQVTFSIPVGTYTIAPGHSLELVVTVDASSGDDMWFAYDTNNHKSRLSVSASADVLPGVTAAPHSLAYWPENVRARLFFA